MLAVLQPAAKKRLELPSERSPSRASFPLPGKDIMVEFRPRHSDKKWHISFSGSDEAMKIASEDWQ